MLGVSSTTPKKTDKFNGSLRTVKTGENSSLKVPEYQINSSYVQKRSYLKYFNLI